MYYIQISVSKVLSRFVADVSFKIKTEGIKSVFISMAAAHCLKGKTEKDVQQFVLELRDTI